MKSLTDLKVEGLVGFIKKPFNSVDLSRFLTDILA